MGPLMSTGDISGELHGGNFGAVQCTLETSATPRQNANVGVSSRVSPVGPESIFVVGGWQSAVKSISWLRVNGVPRPSPVPETVNVFGPSVVARTVQL